MKDKSFAVIGLGQFGMTLAVTLAEADCDVLAIDEKEELIQEIAEKVTYAVKADVREPGILKSWVFRTSMLRLLRYRKIWKQVSRRRCRRRIWVCLCYGKSN